MPGRNIRKSDMADSYYHAYARGVNKQKIFNDPEDFNFFLSLIQRYLSRTETASTRGATFPKLYDDVQLMAYCLMSNHFHLLLHQSNEKGMSKLMQRIMTSYSGYFNKKYGRTGPLFESTYRASCITTDAYFVHISRYIHLNPTNWKTYSYSSLRYYLEQQAPDWLLTGPIQDQFSSHNDYAIFLQSYEGTKAELTALKHELANAD